MTEDHQLRSHLLGIAAGLPVGDPTRRQILLLMQEDQPEVATPPDVEPLAPDPPATTTSAPIVAPAAPVAQAPVTIPVTVQSAPPIVLQAPAMAPAPLPPPPTLPVPEALPIAVPVPAIEVEPEPPVAGPVGPPREPIPIQTRRAFENEFLPEMERMLESSSVEEIRETFLDLVDTATRTKNDYYSTLKYYQALNQTDGEFFDGLKRVIREWNV
jgi:hypothetical protein